MLVEVFQMSSAVVLFIYALYMVARVELAEKQ